MPFSSLNNSERVMRFIDPDIQSLILKSFTFQFSPSYLEQLFLEMFVSSKIGQFIFLSRHQDFEEVAKW
ncbi:hypothetical protein C5167_018167 [Papaver somniferum]|uniref:Uncharacterized protein n=1 Tax=Papaver somniferum TaxID=3469 RepID=A0A4Y7IQH2_PAPSO|nr:hypothetical protein C5167_018167 [Papaver somniferum]